MGPQNGIVGDNNPTELPAVDPVIEEGQKELKQAAKFVTSKEFAELKEHLERRINFYQTYLPNGDHTITKTPDQLGIHWMAANIVIGELKAVIDGYEQAAKLAKEDGNGQ